MKRLIILFFVFLSVNGFAGPKSIVDDKLVDSLERQLKVVHRGEKLDVLLTLCDHLVEKNTEKCMLYGKQALELAKELNRPQNEVQALIHLGRANSNLGNYFKSLQLFKEAAQIAEREEDDRGIVDAWNEIGITYFRIGSYDEALNYYFKTLIKAEEIGSKEKQIALQNNIAIIYSIHKDHEKALEWFNKVLDVYEAEQDTLRAAMTLVNMAYIFDETGEYDKGLDVLKKAIPILIKKGEKLMLSSTLNCRGDIQLKLKNHQKAYDNYSRSLEVAESIKYNRGAIGRRKRIPFLIVDSHDIGTE